MEIFLLQLQIRLPLLRSYWDPRVFSNTMRDDPEGDGAVVKGVTEALKVDDLVWWVEFCLCKGRAVGFEARWNEGCRCHEEMLKKLDPHDQFKFKQNKPNGEAWCAWPGCRAVENAMGRIGIAVGNIRSASSEGLTEWYAKEPKVELRREMLQEEDSITSDLCEELTQKFSFYGDQPFSSLKVMAQYFGGTQEQSKQALVHMFEFYESLEDKCHCPRELKVFCEPGIIRDQLASYLNARSKPLHAYNEAFKEWVAAASNIVVERRLEGEHAKIMAINQLALDRTTKSGASVCADLRHHMLVKLFENDSFVSSLVEHWHRNLPRGSLL